VLTALVLLVIAGQPGEALPAPEQLPAPHFAEALPVPRFAPTPTPAHGPCSPQCTCGCAGGQACGCAALAPVRSAPTVRSMGIPIDPWQQPAPVSPRLIVFPAPAAVCLGGR
jgi:hypothetical protein